MTTLTNSFEGGTNGTGLSTGNTGGTSGNAFDAVNTTGSGSGIAFSNAEAMHGTLSAKLTYAASTSSNVYASWTTSMGAQSQVWFRFYIYITAHPSVNLRIWQSDISAATLCSALFLTTSGTLAFNASGSTAFTTTAAIPLNTWYRLEGYCTGSTSTGQVSLSMYAGDSTTAVETDTSSATQNTGGTQNSYRYGSFASITETSAFSYYIDDVGLSSTGYLGPSPTTLPGAAGLTGSGTMTGTGAFEGAASLSGSGTLAGGELGKYGAALNGTGALSGTGQAGTAILTGTGTLGVPGNPVLDEAANPVFDESGNPVLDESAAGGLYAAVTYQQQAALSGAGTLGAGAGGSAALTGTGTMTAAAAGTRTAAAALTGTGMFTAVPAPAALLTGTGTLAAAWTLQVPAALTGQGAMAAAWTMAALTGTGTLAAAELSEYGAALTGTGVFTAARQVTWAGAAALSGGGTLGLAVTGTYQQQAALAGGGTLGLAIQLNLTLALTGAGYLAVLKVSGGLVNGVGGAGIPYALPGSSQVAVAAPGSSNWQWLGTLGQVTALTYSFACPGGCDKMTCTVMVPAAYRTQLFNPGWQVRIVRGGHDVWHGKLDEPVPTSSGWTLSAVGQGNRGQDFLAIYSSTWPASQPDQSVNGAISRGLPWTNPGVGTPSGAWYGQAVDSGAQTVTALLNLVCTRGGLTWYVNSQPGGVPGDDLSVFPLPTVPNRLLVATTPVARTLGGDINTIFIRYEVSADNSTSGAPAVYATTSVQNAQSVAAHGVIETYIDLSDVGVQTAAAAQAVGNAVLDIYQRASFAGPFTVSYGQLLNTGGAPIDPGTDQAATMVRLILTDYGYGGEVTPQFPITFIVGAYEWDDFAQTATVTPYVALDQSLTGLLSMENTALTPITVASS